MQKQRAHYPFVNLDKALSRAQELFEADPSGRQMSLSAAFTVWGYSLKSSGGHQTVSALKSYGLIEDSGTKGDRKISLTQKALKYFKDERENERNRLRREFALGPKLFANLWGASGWKASPPSDAIARSHLKVDLGLSEQAARAILGIYKENLIIANFTGDDNIDGKGSEIDDDDDGVDENGGDAGSKERNPPKHERIKLKMNERELSAGLLSKGASFRLIVSGEIGAKEIKRLIAKLEVDKEIMADQDDDEENQ